MKGQNGRVVRFETERLVIRELSAEDLVAVLSVYLGNTDYLALTSGVAGDPGRYDLESLQRDFVLAGLTPGRHVAGIYLEEGGEPVGVLDWLEENPSDGRPWLGLVMLRPDHKRRGFASEAVYALAERLDGPLRMGVIARNEAGLAFARRLGFRPVEAVAARMNTTEDVVVYERPPAVASK